MSRAQFVINILLAFSIVSLALTTWSEMPLPPQPRVVPITAVAPEVCTGEGPVVKVTELAHVFTVQCGSDVLVPVVAK